MIDSFKKDEIRYMKRALTLAQRGRLYVSPNPMVGAVIMRDGRIIGEGYHRGFGKAHAEIEAIGDAEHRGESLCGAVLYVTLEPCCHHGKTPPCTDAVISSGISSVVCSVLDPNPLVNGRGVETLRKAGIVCRTGLCEKAARELNEKYFTFMSTGRPFVFLKVAVSLDGHVAAQRGTRTILTGKRAQRYVHRLRSEYEVILVGSGTALIDDPQLTCRGIREGRHPVRVALSTRADLPPDLKMFNDDGIRRVVVFGEGVSDDAAGKYTNRGVEMARVPLKNGLIDLAAALDELGRRDFTSVLIEAGPTLAGSLLKARLVDRVCVCFAPVILGSDSAVPVVGGAAFGTIEHPSAPALQDVIIHRLDPDIAVEGRVTNRTVKTVRLGTIRKENKL